MTGTQMIEQGGKIIARALKSDPARNRGQLIDILMDETDWPLATCHAIYKALQRHKMPPSFVSVYGTRYDYAWEIVPEAEFNRMLGILPPRVQYPKGFLVGEAWTHKACSVANQPGTAVAAYEAFIQIEGLHYRCTMPLTLNEFKAIELQDVIDNLKI